MHTYALRCGVLLSAVTAALGFAVAAQGSTIQLSDLSSDPPGDLTPTPASVLDALFEFNITGATELTLTVTNQTTAPDTYDINEVYFNALSNVDGLDLDSVGGTSCLIGDGSDCGWVLSTAVMVDGFGVHDFGLTDGLGGSPDQILPLEAVDFVFTISGTGPFSMSDFVDFSDVSGGGTPTLAAAKFVNGPGDDSAFGAAIPEPGTATLLVMGLIALTARRR